eukprot:CAMPEP_0185845146 /NCGR_PEP_ID=MMETSP1354-20130828/1192_1 /TAXON_ID=708628 /ORGANISM="Erythrolobus madagascarensis, Strain CCMP3276" /LENGTH=136 /DNA_ID=CAMNT_0028545041 /DNA_START=181 /DNA_END=591 /DNA_ORIENTATION=+
MGGMDVEYVWNESFTLDSMYTRRRTPQENKKFSQWIRKRTTAPSDSDEFEYGRASSGRTDLSHGSSTVLPPVRQSDLAAAVLAARAQDEPSQQKHGRLFFSKGVQKQKHFQITSLRRGNSRRQQTTSTTNDLRFTG